MLKAFLQGKFLGHPLHPALVHVPTGAWTAALLFDLCSISGGPVAMSVASFACIVVGCAAALLAAPTGLADWLEIKPEKPAYKIGLWHLWINVLVLGIFIDNAIVRRDHFRTEPVSRHELLLTIAGVALLAISGYLGWRMVFDYGIGIARMSKKKWREIAARGNSRLPEAKESE